MKTRTGFVSNSSSSSFIIDKRLLTQEQITAIVNHMEYAHLHFPGEFTYDDEDTLISDAWWVHHTGAESDILKLSTSMNNFNMQKFLHWIHVPEEAILERGYS